MSEPRLFLFTSNRMEDLAGMLAERISRGGAGDPFRGESVLVQSRGMARWLSLQLAEAREVCMNVRFPFPREAIEEILRALLPGWKNGAAFRRETMVWSLFRFLGEFRNDRRFAAIRYYLEEGDLLKRIQLADRVANLFDQYLVYRPDWLIAWEREENPEDWQAALWRRLAEEAGEQAHLGRAWERLRDLRDDSALEGELPRRLSVFGISSLPPLFLQILREYACRGGELHLYLLQPTESYWGDLVSRKRQAKMRPGEAVYLEEGHPLVASLGRQGQDLLNLLIDADFQQPEEGQIFREPAGETLLARLQSDILGLVNRTREEAIPVSEEDVSIQVHNCHGPMREVEALHDRLTDLLEKDETLRPRDVLVMIPDIESYAPYIEAVFGAPETGRMRIPYAVVDRRPRSEHHAIDGWFRLLELAGSRFTARDVASLLESPAFRMRFGLSDRDVNHLRGWIHETGVRWGVNAEHRATEGLPEIAETTWEKGIEQWILGYAMRETVGGEPAVFGGTFPFDEVEGGNIGLADLFLRVLRFLFRTREMLGKPRPLADWCETLSDLLEELYGEVDELAFEAEAIRAALTGLREAGKRADSEEALSLDVLRYFLEKAIDDTVSGGGFLSGGVTFCTLQPMRTVPARVVCLLGMDDAAFPRRPQQLGFDRMREERRVGDRSVREDDRYLFLETLLSVRETLLISYVGQSARDLSESPPSVLVSELLDHLDRVGEFPGGRNAREFLVYRHRLQPFHPDYFSGGRLASYSEENAEACRRLMGEPVDSERLTARELAEPEESWRRVSALQLENFFRNPARFFVKERLGLSLPKEETLLEESEIFGLNSLTEYGLRKGAVDELMQKRDRPAWQKLQARGKAPLGNPGTAICHAVHREAEKFVARLQSEIGGVETPENLAIDRRLGEFQVYGEIGPFFGGRLVVYRPANLKAKDLVSAWVRHLVACWETGETETVVVAEDKTAVFAPRRDAEERLGELLEWYWRGLTRPIPFFPAASLDFVKELEKSGEDKALEKAWKAFTGGYRKTGEVEDDFVRMCWEGVAKEDVLAAEFREVSRAVFADASAFV